MALPRKERDEQASERALQVALRGNREPRVLRRHSAVPAQVMPVRTPAQFLAAWFERTTLQPDGCWTVQTTSKSGYLSTDWAGYHANVHRLVYIAMHGDPGGDMDIDHMCRTRNCINPTHLRAVTSKVNTLAGQGPAARKARQTHCIHGHEFTVENTYTNGQRSCKTCKRAAEARRVRA